VVAESQTAPLQINNNRANITNEQSTNIEKEPAPNRAGSFLFPEIGFYLLVSVIPNASA
jgi:hypothetical protein